jgi:DNA-binding response OmpR family regulator
MATTTLSYAARVLIVGPDKSATGAVKTILADAGARTTTASDTQTAAELLYEQQPHFVALTQLPDLREISRWCHELRHEPAGRRASVLLIATPEQLAEVDFAWGIDDYLTIPWDAAKLIGRVRIMQWRREKVDAAGAVLVGGVVINLRTYEVTVRGRQVALTLKEYELLSFLARNQRQVCTREAILDAVWGADYFGGERTVDVHIRRLRAKMPEIAAQLQTVRNVGYRLQP